jgi:hypothetical protein
MIFLQFVNHMHDDEQGVSEKHPRPGKAHDFLYFFPHILFIAMHFAFGANRLVVPEYTLIQTLQ